MNIQINPLPTIDAYMHHDTFGFMISYPAMSLGDRFCMSRKVGQGEVGGAPKGCKQPLAGAMQAISLKAYVDLENSPLTFIASNSSFQG